MGGMCGGGVQGKGGGLSDGWDVGGTEDAGEADGGWKREHVDILLF